MTEIEKAKIILQLSENVNYLSERIKELQIKVLTLEGVLGITNAHFFAFLKLAVSDLGYSQKEIEDNYLKNIPALENNFNSLRDEIEKHIRAKLKEEKQDENHSGNNTSTIGTDED